MKALIIDPALHSVGGHHFSAHQRVVSDLRSLDVNCRSLGSALAANHAIDALGIEPCFTQGVYSRTEWTREEFTQHVEVTYRQLSKALRWTWAKPELLVLPCCDQVLATAIARYLRRFHRHRMPHIVMWLLFTPSSRDSAKEYSIGQMNEYKDAFAELRTVVGDDEKIAVYCETQSLSDVYEKLIGLNVLIAPGPNIAEGFRPSKFFSSSDVKTICCTGHANAPKGYSLLPEAIGRVLAKRRDVHFKIHGTINKLDVEKDLGTFRALSEMGSQVTFLDRVMTDEEYLAWIANSDLLLLPYDPVIYRTRGSGVFSESVILGVPAIASAGCAFAQSAFEAGRAVPIEPYDARGVASAIITALDCLPELSERAKTFASAHAHKSTSRKILQSALNSIVTRRPDIGGIKSSLSAGN